MPDITGKEGWGATGQGGEGPGPAGGGFVEPPVGGTKPPYRAGLGAGLDDALEEEIGAKRSYIELIGETVEGVEKEIEATNRLTEARAALKTKEFNRTVKIATADIYRQSTELERLERKTEKYREAIEAMQKAGDENTETYKALNKALEINEDKIDELTSGMKGLQDAMKKTKDFGVEMMGALGIPSGVTGVIGKATGWAMLATGVMEFAKALHDSWVEMRQLRNEAIKLSYLAGGTGTGFAGGRARMAGEFMGRARINKYMTGMEEQEQAQFMGAGMRAGVITGDMDQAFNMQRQMWALGGTLGEDPSQLLSYATDLMISGVERSEVPQALLDLANNAREAGMGIAEYRENVLSLSRSTRMYGFTLQDSELMVTHFARGLQTGAITLQDISSIFTGGLGNQMRGARGFLGMGLAQGAPWAQGIEGAEAFEGVGDPMQAQARMRRLMETGETWEERTLYARSASAAAKEQVRGMGLDFEGPDRDAALDVYSQVMEETFGISTGKLLETAGDFDEAIEKMKDPTELMKDAATGFMTGQEKFETNIGTLTAQVLQDYENMKSIMQQIQEVVSIYIMMLVLGINELVDTLNITGGGFLTPEMQAGMIGGMAGELTTAFGVYGADAPPWAEAGARFVAGEIDLSKKYGPSGKFAGMSETSEYVGPREAAALGALTGMLAEGEAGGWIPTERGPSKGEGLGGVSTVLEQKEQAFKVLLTNLGLPDMTTENFLASYGPSMAGIGGAFANEEMKDAVSLAVDIDNLKKQRGVEVGKEAWESVKSSFAIGGFISPSMAEVGIKAHGGEAIIPADVTARNLPAIRAMLAGGRATASTDVRIGDINLSTDARTVAQIARVVAEEVYDRLIAKMELEERINANYS